MIFLSRRRNRNRGNQGNQPPSNDGEKTQKGLDGGVPGQPQKQEEKTALPPEKKDEKPEELLTPESLEKKDEKPQESSEADSLINMLKSMNEKSEKVEEANEAPQEPSQTIRVSEEESNIEKELKSVENLLAELDSTNAPLEPAKESVEEESGIKCSTCGADVPEDANRCPKCGIEFEDEIVEESPAMEPASPKEQSSTEASAVPLQGATPTEVLQVTKPKEETRAPQEVPEKPRPSGKKHKMTVPLQSAQAQGHGLVNGNGRPRANGTLSYGLTNGNGFTNGNGVTNGNGLASKSTKPKRLLDKEKVQLAAVSIFIAIIFMLPVINILTMPKETGMRLDGDFADWSSAKKFDDPSGDASSTDIDITTYKIAKYQNALWFYIQTRGDLLSGKAAAGSSAGGLDTVHIFMDTDRNAQTGYSIRGIGADRLITIQGHDGRITYSKLSTFESNNRADWNGWVEGGSVNCVKMKTEMELFVPISSLGGANEPAVFIRTMDSSCNSDESGVIFGPSAVSVLAKEKHIGPSRSDVASFSALSIELTAYGGDATVSSIKFSRLGKSTQDIDISLGGDATGTGKLIGAEGAVSTSCALKKGVTKTITVSLTAPMGIAAGIDIASQSDIIATSSKGALITLAKMPTVAPACEITMIGAAPVSIVIDGSFEDWAAIQSNAAKENANDVLDEGGRVVPNPNLDISDYKGATDTSNVSFYLKVSGSIFGGASVPARFEQFMGTPDNIPNGPLPVVEGKDYAYFLIDIDNSANTGYRATPTVGVDRAIVIEGKDGVITSSKMYKYSGSSAWSDTYAFGTFVSEVSSAKGACELEAQVKRTDLSNAFGGSCKVLYWMKGWLGKDTSDSLVELTSGRTDGSRYYHERAQISFNPASVDIGGGTNPSGVVNCIATADFNNDGQLDIVTGDAGNAAYVWLNPGASTGLTSTWTRYTVVTGLADIVTGIAAGDLDNDGLADIALTTNKNSDDVRVYRNQGSGTSWSAGVDIDTTGDNHRYRCIALGDFDSDGWLDIAAGDQNQDLHIYQNDGTPFVGNWATRYDITLAEGHTVQAIGLADLNNDGRLDIVTGCSAAPGHLRGYENNGNPFSTAWTMNLLATMNSAAIACLSLADLDNNGLIDVVVNERQNNAAIFNLHVYKNPGIATAFSTEWTTKQSVFTSTIATGNYANNALDNIAVDDYDNDGWNDIAISDDAGFVNVYENHKTPFSAGGWSQEFASDIGNVNTLALASGDFDADGNPDLISGDSQPRVRAWNNTLIHRNMPYGPGIDMGDAVGDITGVAVGDLDNDGDLDVVTADIGSSIGGPSDAQIRAYQNPGTATISSWSSWTSYTLYTNRDLFGVSLVDLDNDGTLDIVTGLRQPADFNRYPLALHNPGAATAWTALPWTCDLESVLTTQDITCLATGDLDNNGLVDVAYGMANGAIYICQRNTDPIDNNGDWLTAPFTTWTPIGATSINSIALADLNNDGYLDVCAGATTSTGGTVYIRQNDHTPFDGMGNEFWVANLSNAVNAIACLNYDGDGDIDIASADAGTSNSVKLWQNPNSTATRADPFTTAWGDGPDMASSASVTALCAGDADNDGDPDLASGNITGLVMTHKNPRSEGGSWVSTSVGNVSGKATSIQFANLDNKINNDPGVNPDLGDLDIVCGDDGGDGVGSVFIFENTGANMNITVTPTATSTMYSGSTDDVFQLDVRHNGFFPDNNATIATLRFKYPGKLIADINNVIQTHYLYLESNNIAGWQADDTRLSTQTPTVTDGEVTIKTTDWASNVSAGSSKTFYYVIQLQPTAHNYPAFSIEFDGDGYISADWNEMNATLSPAAKVATIENASLASTGLITPAVPEFGEIAVPLIATTAVVLAIGARRRRKN